MQAATTRQPAEPFRFVVDPAGWTKGNLALSSGWIYPLNDREIADLDRAVAEVGSRQTPLIDVRREGFELPLLGKALREIREQIINGRGFALLRGIPVHRYTRLQSAIAFWGIGTHIGETVSQNAKGHLLGHVKDLGDKTLDNPAHRGYQTPDKLPYHSDSSDVVGLLCLHPSKTGGESTITSSVTIHNE
ncbi:MAG TPA: TauD/TfdA family dioxygenase, partial [Candidatus Baltobacteraceae bacterium]|nr:TauD/TfdA family dioxygenase [Candidatus Baltobacteraceae bacterium]